MSADGKWDVTINSPMGAQKVALQIKTSGNTFTGVASGGAGGAQTTDFSGTVDGDTLSWSQNITQPMPLKLDIRVKVAGNDMTGSVKAGAFGSSPLTGTRVA
jgi:hypothetical protein